ncbi:MAG TPA: hypothetical protein VKU02_29500 [Gemmataceae bacterium]|nr:hypothetical protein [Gemmataceae bacterium]
MAKTRTRRSKGGETVSGYFRKIFAQHPELLDSKSNQVLVERWKADHGATAMPNPIRSNLANLKSLLRKRRRLGLGIGEQSAAPAAVSTRSRASNGLETLEEQIDDCLTMAKNLDRTGLGEVIDLLRMARNKVVWRIGE